MYNFTHFAVALNELDKDMLAVLAPTDCRLRPDIRYMESGDLGKCLGWSSLFLYLCDYVNIVAPWLCCS